jgi:uncharacterized protein YjlB
MQLPMDVQRQDLPIGVLSDAQVEAFRLEPSAGFPNNPRLPALLYRGAFRLPGHSSTHSSTTRHLQAAGAHSATELAARTIEKTFARHRWSSGWRDGVYDYHHYHSTAHEVLGCYSGRATLQLGGPFGQSLSFASGDVLVLPACTAHKLIASSEDFCVVGAYERGRSYDMQLGDPAHHRASERRAREVPLPEFDPVYGDGGPLLLAWRADLELHLQS